MTLHVATPKYRKSAWIAQDMRQQIVRGRFGADGRLPTRVELCSHYGVSLGTVQKALQSLADEGFIRAEGTRGTTVAPDSPHLSHYAILMPSDESWVRGNQLMSALVRLAGDDTSSRRFTVHYGVESTGSYDAHRQLIQDVEHRRIAGLIFAVAPFFLKDTAVVQQPGIPRVAIMTGGLSLPMPGVGHERLGLYRLVAGAIAARGRCRPALITPPHHLSQLGSDWQQACREAGLQAQPRLMQQCPLSAADWLPNLIDLLLDQPADLRPDSLYIADDHLLEATGQALRQRGLSIPDDLFLLGLANFPWPTPCAVPVLRLGYSVPELLDTCIRLIDAQRDGLPYPKLTHIPPMTADQYPGLIHPPCRLGH